MTRRAGMALVGALGVLAPAGRAGADALPAITCPDAPPHQVGAPPAPPRGLAEVDWCNFDFGGLGRELRGGVAELHEYPEMGAPHDTHITRLRAVVWGDLDGDRRPEAVVVLEGENWLASGHTWRNTDVLVFTWRRGQAHRLGEVPAGTPVSALRIRRGVIEVTSGPDHAVTTYRRGKRGFVPVRRARR